MLNFKKLINDNKLILKLNKDNLDYYIKNTKKIIRYCDNKNLILEIYYNNKKLVKENLSSKIDNDLRDMITIMIAINYKDKYDRFEFIYDTVCSYLDERIKRENYCEFINNQCIRDRLRGNDHKNGCCECIGRGKCKYLIDGVCTENNCLACKLFTCKILEMKGIKQNINDFVLIKYFFTNKQKDILRFSYWTPKEIVMDRLMKNKYVRP